MPPPPPTPPPACMQGAKPVQSPAAATKKAKTSPAPLTRRNSSGSMGAQNTAGAKGRAATQVFSAAYSDRFPLLCSLLGKKNLTFFHLTLTVHPCQVESITKYIALAKNWEPGNKKHEPTGWIMSEKLDGVRCYWNGNALYTRNGHLIGAPANFVQVSFSEKREEKEREEEERKRRTTRGGGGGGGGVQVHIDWRERVVKCQMCIL